MSTLFRRFGRRSLAAGAAVLLLGLVAGALQFTSAAKADSAPQCSDAVTSAPTGPATVSTAATSDFGNVLVVGSGDHAGCSLYLLTSDQLQRIFSIPTEAFWDVIIELNYKGCLRVCRRVVPGMVEREYGRVVNISSDAARVGSSLEAVYAGGEGPRQVGFGKTLAREVARRGVTVNSRVPGADRDAAAPGAWLGAGEASAKMVEALRRAVPMRRLGRPDDVAAAVAFLTSDARRLRHRADAVGQRRADDGLVVAFA